MALCLLVTSLEQPVGTAGTLTQAPLGSRLILIPILSLGDKLDVAPTIIAGRSGMGRALPYLGRSFWILSPRHSVC